MLSHEEQPEPADQVADTDRATDTDASEQPAGETAGQDDDQEVLIDAVAAGDEDDPEPDGSDDAGQ